MTADPADDTRTRILRAALDLFAEHGYQRTSLRQIGERLRLTKAAILYHFPAKEHLLAALVEPLLADLEALLDAARGQPTEQARWTLLEGWVDTMLAHRRPLGMLFHDIALVGRNDTYHRLMAIAMRANEVIAGPDAGRRERVRAVQAVAACSDPIVFFTDVPDEVLRADMLDGVRRLLATSAPDAVAGAPERRRPPGRPRALGREQVEKARRMHAAGTHSVDAIAATLGVSRATVYRHLDNQ
ncbi:TetR family transcriptional regulator [Micromonospora sp. RHAY321]|uniref:TetR family transcriptional regulator n=1 Tax=Micromonospora sp. RHAY321 TaxID=2944807 RepID=UPI00207CE22D|nr:TetR family transcriptional regulator [Micromonospora sp. RHAY321]MCO1594857.1 TetR family transcriptional regulator [Micromonospora sp. RHAY321]